MKNIFRIWKNERGMWRVAWTGKGHPNRFGEKCQICWTCEKAGGLCSWSREFKPVPGWDAEPDTMKPLNGNGRRVIETYKIYDCPEYEEAEHEKPMRRNRHFVNSLANH